MHRRRLALALTGAGAAALLVASPASGITSNGVPDDGEHPYAGAMLSSAEAPGIRCSGSMLSPTVFLTAAHCTDGLIARGQQDAFVTLDEHYVQGKSKVMRGTMHQDPGFPASSSDPHDIAVIELDEPVRLDTFAALPRAGRLSEMADAGQLRGTAFEVVGYGVQEAVRGPGGHTFPGSGDRLKARESFNAINPSWLRLSQNQAKGDGGACFGDSGGPNFLGGDSNVVAAITITGDAPCYATNVVYRTDTPSARAFLGDHVALP
ncbi:MAG: trypsin-like serine protease [Carbonactinosporaceae bacterium]